MTYRILTLDGGGSWALLQAMALKALAGDLPGRQILGQFDLAVANSGGSIVLGALIKDLKPTEIVALFRDGAQRRRIFKLLPFSQRLTNEALGSVRNTAPTTSATGSRGCWGRWPTRR